VGGSVSSASASGATAAAGAALLAALFVLAVPALTRRLAARATPRPGLLRVALLERPG
jgi:hypothetical protein